MASTYSTNLAIELIGTGDQAGSWGNTTNTNLGTLIEQAISGYVTQAMTTGNTTTITIPNGATGVARNMYIEMTGTGGTNTFLVVPANKKLYFIYNNTTGAVTVKVSGQTGVSVAAGDKTILVSNGTDVVSATTFLTSVPSSLTVTTLTATSANITTLTGTSADITTITGTTIGTTATTQLKGASATITTLTGTSADITTITGTTIGTTATTQLKGASATITNLSGTSAQITTITGTNIGTSATTQLQGLSATITTLSGSSANITTATHASANITTLTGTSATITNILDGLGLVRTIPQVSKGANYTLTTADNGTHINLTAGIITVPNNTFSAGNVVTVYNNSTGTLSLTISTTTGYVAGTNTSRTGLALATRGVATILFINPSACVVAGNVT